MVVLRVEFQGTFAWAIRPDDPLLFPIETLPVWSFVNPALYPAMEHAAPPTEERTAKATFIIEGLCYFISTGFFLISHENDPDRSVDFWMHQLPALAAHLRSASKQSSLSPKLTRVGPTNIAIPTAIILPTPGGMVTTGSWHLRTAIQAENILLAGRQPLNDRPPSYDTLLLDAIDSLHQEDFPTAFLLAAISMDHLTSRQAELAFTACLQQGNITNLSIALPASMSPDQRKEREGLLSDLLIHNRRFQDLLKRVLPALTGRSLQHENKNLYDQACNVYKIRNRIVHKELTFTDDTPRFAGSDEAINAIKTAVRLAAWFGVPAHYAHAYDGVPPPITIHTAAPPGGSTVTTK